MRHDVIVIIQSEPRDGINVYAVADEATFRSFVRSVLDEDSHQPDEEEIELGVRYYADDDSYIEGHATTVDL
jgi:hypothetical protein